MAFRALVVFFVAVSAVVQQGRRANWNRETNLYKVAPKKGNPDQPLQKLQHELCQELLRLELESYRPKRILFLTGQGWARPFLKELQIKVRPVKNLPRVEGVGEWQGTPVVVLPHTQGKKEKELVQQAAAYFKMLG